MNELDAYMDELKFKREEMILLALEMKLPFGKDILSVRYKPEGVSVSYIHGTTEKDKQLRDALRNVIDNTLFNN